MPNPFVRTALLRYSLSRPARVSIKVYDRAGRLVRAILEGECQPGVHVARWDGTDARGRRVANGVYFARLRTGNLAKVRKLVLSR
jgi:flagellar hook assembly protein FlgD